MPTRRGSIRIFRLFGIDVYLHWSWLLVAVLRIEYVHYREYSSPLWYVIEYFGLFAIVLMHEFGHALACRQVGGQANQIILWPLGGVAYVSPPQRPAAVLWSIAAGPLVNVALFPIFSVFWFCSYTLGWPDTHPDVNLFLRTLWQINLVLLIFNILPVYPLDGGKILYSLLWFIVGRAKGLFAACIIGILGIILFCLLAFLAFFSGEPDAAQSGTWILVMGAFMAINCWGGLRQAFLLSKLEKAPRHPQFTCPSCHESPPVGEFWVCGRCRKTFDTFLSHAMCPHCNTEYPTTACPFCHTMRPFADWFGGTPAPTQPPQVP